MGRSRADLRGVRTARRPGLRARARHRAGAHRGAARFAHLRADSRRWRDLRGELGVGADRGARMTRILVVEDDAPLRDALVTSLRAHGYEASEAGTAEEAVIL